MDDTNDWDLSFELLSDANRDDEVAGTSEMSTPPPPTEPSCFKFCCCCECC